MDQVLRHVTVVGQQLLGVFGQAVAAVTKTGVVVMIPDAGVQTHAIDDLAGVQAVRGRVGVELVEIGHAQGQVGVGEQLDGLRLGAVGQQDGDVFFDRALLQQMGKYLSRIRAFTHDDAAGVKVVVQRSAFAQELGAEDDVGDCFVATLLAMTAAGLWIASPRTQCLFEFGGVAHRHGGFDDHHRMRVDRQHTIDHRLDASGVEVVGLGVVVGGGGDDDVVCVGKGFHGVGGGLQAQWYVLEVMRNVRVVDGRLSSVDHVDFGREDVQSHHVVVLGQ